MPRSVDPYTFSISVFTILLALENASIAVGDKMLISFATQNNANLYADSDANLNADR